MVVPSYVMATWYQDPTGTTTEPDTNGCVVPFQRSKAILLPYVASFAGPSHTAQPSRLDEVPFCFETIGRHAFWNAALGFSQKSTEKPAVPAYPNRFGPRTSS